MRILYTYLMKEIINYGKPQIIYKAVLIKQKTTTNFQLLFPKELQKLS